MKRLFVILLIVIYCLAFGEIYVRISRSLQVTNTQLLDTKKILSRKVSMQIPGDAGFSVLLLGDSKVAGVGVDPENNFSTILEKNLNSRLPGSSTKVVNVAVYGFNTYMDYEMFRKFTVDNPGKKPDFVLLSYYWDDAYGEYPEGGTLKPPETKQSKLYLLKRLLYNSELLKILISRPNRLLKKHGIFLKGSAVYRYRNEACLPDNKGWQKTKEYLKKMHDISRRKKIHFAVLLLPDFTTIPKNFYEKNTRLLKEFCEKNNIELIEGYSGFEGVEDDNFSVSVFDVHPNRKANEILAEHTTRDMLEILARREQ